MCISTSACGVGFPDAFCDTTWSWWSRLLTGDSFVREKGEDEKECVKPGQITFLCLAPLLHN